jgi:hypothetical protein
MKSIKAYREVPSILFTFVILLEEKYSLKQVLAYNRLVSST